ncbi:hypothetical protein [Peribacillus loiseleuriae]|uniref:Uncharacterized protein n=1 Tax=Peribacillus loiseleuriae TaxID=1679170 RepID=A0A0K9GSD4_9BACI|nr:hypothetical protein [Peribacillus loiseleuriae]KMY49599.1 hypothetical protein AC625_08630 [Peribacillus loiseleuriae]
MKKIVIEEHTEYAKVYLIDFNEEEPIRPTQKLMYQELITKINELIQKYNLEPNHKIINEHYDEKRYLVERIEQTVEEYYS